MRRLIAAVSMTVTTILAALSLHDSPVSAAPKPILDVALSPSSAIAGSTGNTLTFTFVATEASTSRATVTIPTSASGAPWSPPQTVNSSGAGYVTVQALGCNSAMLAGIVGAGPWTLAIDYKCGNNKSFVVTYRATAAARADLYTFATQVKVGQVFLPTSAQPVVTVTPAAASTLTMTGLAAATAGAAQSATVRAYDAFGNLATGYLGTVQFTANDPLAALPANYAFTAADAGTRAFTNAVVLKTAGSRTVTATGTAVTVPGTQTVSVSPGSAASLVVTGLVTAIAGTPQTATATAKDAYGNVATGYGGAAAIASSDAQAVLPPSGSFVNGARTFAVTLKTGGSQSVSATDGTVTGSQTVTITAAAASVMKLTGLADTAAAGASQSGFVTLFDPYSNVANGYLGTVHFAASDANATLPGNHTFTEADNGIYPFTGLVLTTAGSTNIVVADTVATALQDVKVENVSPGAVASLKLQWGAAYLPYAFLIFPGFGNCNVTPFDAYQNKVLAYTGTIVWTTNAASFSLPSSGPYNPSVFINGSNYQCDFYSPGTHTLTVTDLNNSSLTDTKTFQVLPPSPKADDITVLDPTHRGGVTLETLDPLNNDWETPVRITFLTLASVGQASYTDNGNIYQLGVARLDAAKRTVLWELDPPGDATASVPGASLARCHQDGVGCAITQPITLPYTVTDSVSSTGSTMTLHISTPTTVFSLPEITFAAWPGGAVPSDKPGLLIPSSVTLIPAVISPPEPVTGARSIVLNGTFSGTGVCGTADCTIQTTASVVIPDIGTAELIGVSLSQSIDVISPIRNNNFRSVMITTAPPSGGVPPPNYFGTLFNLTSTTCFDHSGTPIPCPADNGPSVDLAGLVGLEPDFVNRTLVNSGYSVVPLCTVAADGGQNGIVTAVAFTAPGPDQVYGSRVAVHYAKSSCP